MANPIFGDDKDNVISSGYIGDTIFAMGGNDIIHGGWGDDMVFAGLGNDTLNGGQNNDFLSGDEGDDTLNGDTGHDSLNGGAGKDMINGGAGDDYIMISKMSELVGVTDGKAWGDVIDGGSGVDLLSLTFSSQSTAVVFSGKDPILVNSFGAATIKNVEQYQITGSTAGDTLTGYLLSDTLSGGKGDDILKGLDGFDFLQGGEGSDTINGGNDSDFLTGDAGVDTLAGDAGNDSVQGGAAGDKINGGNGDDYLSSHGISFDGKGDVLAEIDNLVGGNGDDRIEIGMKDIADGGAHIDTVQLDFTASTLAENFVFSANMTFANGGSAKNFEALSFFGGVAGDKVTGGADADSFNGGGGADVLRGALGDDTFTDSVGFDQMFGDAGNDTFHTGGVNTGDLYDGGLDRDTLVFWDGEDDADDVTMSGFLDLENQKLNDGLLKGDTFRNIETFIGSSKDDFMFGNFQANTFIGGDGDDVLDGRAGNDTLIGGEGSDTMTGGLGKDVFDMSGQDDHGAWFGDIITDFSRAEGDKLQISLESLGLEAAPNFTIVVGNNPAPTGSGPQLLFDTATDRLWFDADGAGTEHEGMLVATLENVTTLAVSDFQFI